MSAWEADQVTSTTRAFVQQTASGLLQLDSIQSDAVRRSLRMRSERKALEIADHLDAEAEEVYQRRVQRRQSLSLMLTTFGRPPPTFEKADALLASVEGKHVVGFGAYRGNDVTQGHDDVYAARAARAGGDGAVKDARMLSAIRRDLAKAIGVAFDFAGSVASADVYVRRLRESVRLLGEIRATLQSIAADSLYHLVDDLAAVVVQAVQDPSRTSGVVGLRSRPTPQQFYEGFHGNVSNVLHRAVLGPAGDAVRLLLRVRAFLAQLQARLDQVDYSLPTALGNQTIITGIEDNAGWRSSAGSSASVTGGGDPDSVGRAKAAAAPALKRPGDKPAAGGLEVLAAGDARFVVGEVTRCWEVHRIGQAVEDEARAKAEAHAAAPPAVVEVFTPFSPGSPVSRTLRSGVGFGSPAAAKAARAAAKAAAAAAAAASVAPRPPATGMQREPLYDALHLDAQPGLNLSADALAFMRFPRAFFCAIAADVVSIDSVSPDDAMAHASIHAATGNGSRDSVADSSGSSAAAGTDFMAAVLVQTNVPRRESLRVCTSLLWMLWRNVLLLYATISQNAPYPGAVPRLSSVRAIAGSTTPAASPSGGGFAVLRSGAAVSPHSPISSPADRNEENYVDLARGSVDRRTLDVHTATILYRMLEAAAAVHVFPLG